MGSHPIRYRLPTQYTTAIGRVITRFAVLESALRNLIYALLDVGPKMGRVAVRSPRVDEAFTMIQDLMALRGFTITINVKRLAKDCKQLEGFRDKMAHGVWVKHPKSGLPILQVTAGSYPEKPGGQSIKARIRPSAVQITMQDFRDYTQGIDFALRAVKQLAKELGVQHAALQKKSRG